MITAVRYRDDHLETTGCRVLGDIRPAGSDHPAPPAGAGAVTGDTALDIELDETLPAAGSMTFFFRPPQGYYAGNQAVEQMDELFVIPGFGSYSLGLPWDIVSVILRWDYDENAGEGFKMTVLPELPGPEWYHFGMTWDAADGRLTFYLNGTPTAVPDQAGNPFKMADDRFTFADVRNLQFNTARFAVAELELRDEYRDAAAMLEACPEELRGKRQEIFGIKPDVQPIETADRRGKLLYENPLAEPDDIADWVLDAGVISFEDGWMKMESEDAESTDVNIGHQVIWCPPNFPTRFVAEWDIQVLRNHLIIVFFAARGTEGRDLFDPSMPTRRGEFIHYIKEDIRAYHISYHASGRGITNLRKDGPFYLMSTGPTGIPAGSRDIHRIRLIKDHEHIQLHVDDRVALDAWDNDPERWGAPYEDGKIGFRHMRLAVARYRNLKVWELH